MHAMPMHSIVHAVHDRAPEKKLLFLVSAIVFKKIYICIYIKCAWEYILPQGMYVYTYSENALQAARRCVHLRGAARASGARGPRIIAARSGYASAAPHARGRIDDTWLRPSARENKNARSAQPTHAARDPEVPIWFIFCGTGPIS